MNDDVILTRCLETACRAAKKAGTGLRDGLSADRTISYKGTIDLVTDMDHWSEMTIVEMIMEAFPDHSIVAEERTQIESGSGYLWIIDPVDGTTNYAHGYPNFAVSIGVERDGIPVVGVVYDPMRDELFTAIHRGGSFLNGQPLKVSENALLIRSLLATGFPYDRTTSAENNLNYFNAMILACQEIRRTGSAALDLCSVAAGRLDGYWELKLKPWDVAAGTLIVREAGGRVSDLAGRAFTWRDAAVVASNGRIHELMLSVLEQAATQR